VLRDRALAINGDAPNPYLEALINGSAGISLYIQGNATEATGALLKGEAQMRHVPGASWELASVKLFVIFNLRSIGDYPVMRARYDEYVAEAQQRGDQYLSSTMRRASVTMWLAEDNPEGARADLAEATWVPVSNTFHIQHFHLLIGEIELALYTDDRARFAELREQLARCERALIMRVVSVQSQCVYARARMALRSGDLRGATIAARELRKIKSKTPRAWALLIDACVAREKGDAELAKRTFAETAALADESGMRVFAAMARWAAGDEDQRATIVALGVKDPEKLAAAFAPRPA
jgi:hypothetical protein